MDTTEYLLSVSLCPTSAVSITSLSSRSFYTSVTYSSEHNQYYFTREIDLDLNNGKWAFAVTVSLRQQQFGGFQSTLVKDIVSIPSRLTPTTTTADSSQCQSHTGLQWLDGEKGLASLVVKDNKIQCVRLVSTPIFRNTTILQSWHFHQRQQAVVEHNKKVFHQAVGMKLKPLKKRLAWLQQEMQQLDATMRKKEQKYSQKYSHILNCDTKQKLVDCK